MLSFRKYLLESKISSEDHSEYDSPDGGIALISHFLETPLHPLSQKMLYNGNKNLSEGRSTVVHDKIFRDTSRELHLNHESPEGYGRPMGKPLNREEAIEAARKAVEEHYSKSPEEQAEAIEEARKRYAHTRFGDKNMSLPELKSRIISSNKKTGMNVDNPLVKRKSFDGKIRTVGENLGFGGLAKSATLYHDSSLEHKTTIGKCPNATKDCANGHTVIKDGKTLDVAPSCLAQSGGYGMAGWCKKGISEDHARHGKDMTKDHAILLAHFIKSIAEKHKKNGKVIDIRHQVSDQEGDYTHGIVKELIKHNPNLKDYIHSYDYNKNYEDVLRNLRSQKSGEDNIHGNFSHSGPTYYEDEDGNRHINHKNSELHSKFFRALQAANEEGLDHHTYLVRGGRQVDEDGNVKRGNPSIENVHKQPRSHEDSTNYTRVDNRHTHTRFYKLNNDMFEKNSYHKIRELMDGEPEEEHNLDKNGEGHGYVTVRSNGKRIRVPYYQYRTNHVEGHGHVHHNERTDGAAGGVGHSRVQASSGVASTPVNAGSGEHPNSLFHQMHVHFNERTGRLDVADPHQMARLGHDHLKTSTKIKS